MMDPKAKSLHGFSVVEMLVAVGLMSIVTLGVMTVWGNVTESQKSVAALQDISSFETRLKKLMADEVVCKSNFEGKTMPAVSTTAAPTNLPVDRIETSSGGTLIYDRFTKFTEGKVDITAMRIVNQYKFAANKAVGSLEIEYKDKAKRTYKRTMPVIFVLDAANKIETCSGSTVIIETATIRTACEVGSNGGMYYDETLKKCVAYPTDKFDDGLTYTANCPATHRVVSCEYKNSNYNPTVDKNFTKGGTIPMPTPEFSGVPNKGTNSCDCDYTTDLLAATPGVICVAACTQNAP